MLELSHLTSYDLVDFHRISVRRNQLTASVQGRQQERGYSIGESVQAMTMAGQETRHKEREQRPAAALYTSKIIKAGALLADTKTLLAHWDLTASVPENLRRIRHQNLFGKASRSRVED